MKRKKLTQDFKQIRDILNDHYLEHFGKIDHKDVYIFRDDNYGFSIWYNSNNLDQAIGFTKIEAIEYLLTH